MRKLDEKKEHIGILKVYLSFLVAIILSVGAGVSKLYLSNQENILFWLGIIMLIFLIIIFIAISKKIHMTIKSLKDL